jgi:RNA polymerase sigma-70 factor (ECF subfamily)
MSTARDPAAFCEALSERLVGSLTLFCGDRGAAEELAQDALVRALERWDEVEAMAAPEAWVYRTAFNLARSRYRRRAAERRSVHRLAASARMVSETPDTASAVTLRELVRALPERQRAAIVARFYAGLTVQEAAGALECAPGTVRALTHQAMTTLRASGLVDIDEPEDTEAPEEVSNDARPA